jgi:hypothetical protein
MPAYAPYVKTALVAADDLIVGDLIWTPMGDPFPTFASLNTGEQEFTMNLEGGGPFSIAVSNPLPNDHPVPVVTEYVFVDSAGIAARYRRLEDVRPGEELVAGVGANMVCREVEENKDGLFRLSFVGGHTGSWLAANYMVPIFLARLGNKEAARVHSAIDQAIAHALDTYK